MPTRQGPKVEEESKMKKVSFMVVFFIVSFNTGAHGGLFDTIKEGVGLSPKQSPDSNTTLSRLLDNDTIISGLKEALSIGTEKAVTSVSQVDGYLGNEVVKIPMPDKIQKVATVLGRLGYQKEVDDFVLSMNRAAEKAAPAAASIFASAIKEMTFHEASDILYGSGTAATDYFQAKTSGKIYETFKPIISSSMDEVGVTRSYKEMMDKYTSLAFMKSEALDLDHYVTDKALDGLFYMVGQEEKKIRTNPADRVTSLLKQVFGN